MKFSRLSPLSVAVGACAALACGGSDPSPTNSQGDVGGSGTPNSTTGESSHDAGAAKGNSGTAAPSPTATSSASPPSSPTTGENSGDAGAASTSPSPTTGENSGDASAKDASATATSTSTSPSPMTGESSRDAGAAEDSAGVASSTTSAPPVYFIADVYPILLANCGMTCHANGDSTNGGLTLGTSFPSINVWEELTQHTASNAAPDTTCDEVYVSNQDPAGSLLYQKITGVGIPAGCGVQMPKGGPYLSAADQETIKNWILDDEILTR